MLFIKIGNVFAHLFLWTGMIVYLFAILTSFLDGFNGSAIRIPRVDTDDAILAMLAGISLGILAQIGARVVQIAEKLGASQSESN
jgi:hypothetical protein